MIRALLLALCLATPVRAGVPEAAALIAPGLDLFAQATATLDRAARADCTPETLRAPWNAAFDAWLTIAHFRLGPVEDRALSVAFWPDPKGMGLRAQKALLAGGAFHLQDQSIAARGLFALERLLYGDALPGDTCALIRATTADLAATAALIVIDWPNFAQTIASAGDPGNATFLTRAEAAQALFTQLATGLEFLADERLGRPLGTFDKPRPDLAEARLSGRAARNITLSLAALRDLAAALNPDATQTLAAIDKALTLAADLDPSLAQIADPQGRLRVEILQQTLRGARDVAILEVGGSLGVGLGFNSQDGD